MADPRAIPDPTPAGSAGSERIAAAFAGHSKQAALMPYLMGGFPDLPTSRRIGEASLQAGADVLEVGIPFSDPLADGPVIHDAGTRALAAGATPAGVLDVAGQLADQGPVVVMCYANLVLARGPARFAEALEARGISGLIVPDLPFEESEAVLEACDAHGVALIPLMAPTSSDERMTLIGDRARGFVYAVSVTGTTGERSALSDQFGALVRRAAAHTQLPVAVGFGIATPEQAAEAARAGADGVIVGSRLVRAAAEADAAGDDPAAAVDELVGALARGLAR
ncbi:MAG TPA: tryptophan synthase subunit alpha [Solirubrobacteraceae bacterium]|nr:tryptophan synthase subunit alpha [Solirubrobacteraceae bacterium]